MVDFYELGLSLTGSDSEDVFTGFKHCVSGRDVDDLAGELEAGNVWRVAGRRRIVPPHLKQIGTIQSGSTNTYENIAPGRLRWFRNVSNLKILRTAEFSYVDCLHEVGQAFQPVLENPI